MSSFQKYSPSIVAQLKHISHGHILGMCESLQMGSMLYILPSFSEVENTIDEAGKHDCSS